MKEYMILAFPDGDHLESLTPAEKQKHLDRVMAYLEDLDHKGKLKSAQPLANAGRRITGKKGVTTDGPFVETKESVAGYFHILADSMKDATQIARANPLFDLELGGRLEVRPIGNVNQA
ncbi:YciI family protein [Fulvivirgaceae bacterium BMA12]|uniref:YciI family protein n=1 Tax=Agaribacillus aureus TaxID=3051825 RepID=A0ABT8L9V6_9BACT|nr:YciI family protein [Fulvivirgaceae bacterium BMA12]